MNRNLFYLIYVSSAARPLNNTELVELLEQSREKNKRLDITGMLLYQEGTFMQMLEGEEQTVAELYGTIISDERHTGVMTMLTGNISERNFVDWSMGFFHMEKTGEFPKYDDYFRENVTLRDFKEDSQDAFRFITMFKDINR